MFGNSKKRSRLVLWEGQRRAERQRSPAEEWERRRRMLYRLLAAGCILVAISLLVHAGGGGWGPPFPFREGEVRDRDIRSRLDFEVVEEAATGLRREEARAAVLPVLRLDPAPLDELRLRLTQLCLAARSGSISRLDQKTVSFWALNDNDLKALGGLLQGSPEGLAGLLVLSPQPLPGAADALGLGAAAMLLARAPIESDDDLRRRIEAALDDLAKTGILEDQEREPPDAVKNAKKLTILRPDGSRAEVLPEQVRKSNLVGSPPKDKGPIYLHFVRALKNDQIAERLYELVVGTPQRPSRLPVTLTFDADGTLRAQDDAYWRVPEQTRRHQRGAPLVEGGKPITEQALALLRAEHAAYLASLSRWALLQRWLALFLIVGMLGGFVGAYIWRFLPGLWESLPRLIAVGGLITLTIGLTTLSQTLWSAAVIPLSMTAMILALTFDQPFALVVSFSMALLTALSLGTSIGHLLVLVSGLTVAVLLLRDVRTRVRLVQVGLAAGLTFAVMTLAVGLLTQQSWTMIGLDAGRRLAMGLLAGIVLSGILPFLERLFGITTDISLLELADVSHPLLQELLRRAPGTYTHSMTVATLAETAAEAVSANPLLTRVGACFHDIGKMLKPHYFVENQTGENRHEGLEPAMSTLIIIGHVKDGVELGLQHPLPAAVIDFIEQHHGTTLVEYFYREATRGLEDEQAGNDLEASFRYPGPKPQSKEIGVLMLADAVESASRALVEPAPSTLKKLVHDILHKRLTDGQFDECGLTLSELKTIEDSLCKNLIALYHARVKYPDAKTAG